MQQLFGLGRELRQAQTRLDGEQLRSLPAQREDLIAELLGSARRHAGEAGVQPTEAALSEVEATLHAGLVDLAAAAAVLSGHLVRPMSHTGFGPLPQVESAGEPSGPAPDQLAEWRMWPVEDELRRRREQSDAAPVDHLDRPDPATAVPLYGPVRPAAVPAEPPVEILRRAEADLAAAASAHWQREHDLAEAEAAMEAVNDRQEWLEQQRMQVRRERVSAEQDLAVARTAQRAALRALTEARRALEDAEKRFQAPDDPDD
jgi:hypothetical protein